LPLFRQLFLQEAIMSSIHSYYSPLLHAAGTRGAEFQKAQAGEKPAQTQEVAASSSFHTMMQARPSAKSAEPADDPVAFSKEKAILAFLEEKKIEYQQAGDKTPGWLGIRGDLTPITPQEFKAAVKNPFVIKIRSLGDNIAHGLKNLAHQSQIASSSNPHDKDATQRVNKVRGEIAEQLQLLKDWSRENDTEADAAKFFSEYMQFAHNKSVKLQTLYDAYRIA
jgi:hypothetical protein